MNTVIPSIRLIKELSENPRRLTDEEEKNLNLACKGGGSALKQYMYVIDNLGKIYHNVDWPGKMLASECLRVAYKQYRDSCDDILKDLEENRAEYIIKRSDQMEQFIEKFCVLAENSPCPSVSNLDVDGKYFIFVYNEDDEDDVPVYIVIDYEDFLLGPTVFPSVVFNYISTLAGKYPISISKVTYFDVLPDDVLEKLDSLSLRYCENSKNCRLCYFLCDIDHFGIEDDIEEDIEEDSDDLCQSEDGETDIVKVKNEEDNEDSSDDESSSEEEEEEEVKNDKEK